MLRCAPEDEKQRSKRCKWPVEISQDSTNDSKGNQQGCWFLPGKKCLGQTWSKRPLFREWDDAEMLQVWLCLSSRWCIMDDLIFSFWLLHEFVYVHQNALAIIRYSAFESTIVRGFSKQDIPSTMVLDAHAEKDLCRLPKSHAIHWEQTPVFQLVKMIRW